MLQEQTHWRLIPLMDGPGSLQMAIDTWLLNRQVKGLDPPILRFYTWSSPTLSLGYHQRRFPETWRSQNLQGHPLRLVRRPTGGRAVLHGRDLCYSLIGQGSPGSRQAVYRHVCGFLISGLQQLGLTVTFGQAGRGYAQVTDCFQTATGADLVQPTTGAKLVGSAQRWCNGVFLQQGSIQLRPDQPGWESVFGQAAIMPQLPAELQALSASELNDRLVRTLVEAAQSYFAVTLQTSPLNPQDMNAALQEADVSI